MGKYLDFFIMFGIGSILFGIVKLVSLEVAEHFIWIILGVILLLVSLPLKLAKKN